MNRSDLFKVSRFQILLFYNSAQDKKNPQQTADYAGPLTE